MKFTTEKHWCPVSTFSYFHGKPFLGKPATITFDEKIMDQIQTVVWQFFCASLGRSLCHGNKHHGIDPNMSNSGHHDSSTHLHLSYKIHSSKDFSCSMKFTTEKHWCPVSTFSYFHGKAFLGKPATITFDEKIMDQIQTVVWQFFCVSLRRSLCHGNKHHGIDPNMSSSGHHDCSRKPVFPLHSCLSLQSCNVLAHQFADSRSCNMLTHGILYSTSACHSGLLEWRADGVAESKVDQRLSKCTAQLLPLNLMNQMCLSNSDFNVQSVSYNSAQSPTNWESIHGKAPSIFCRLSSHKWYSSNAASLTKIEQYRSSAQGSFLQIKSSKAARNDMKWYEMQGFFTKIIWHDMKGCESIWKDVQRKFGCQSSELRSFKITTIK